MFSPQVVLTRDGTRLVWANRSLTLERRLDSLGIFENFATPRRTSPHSATSAPAPKSSSPAEGMAIVPAVVPRTLTTTGGRAASWGNDGFVYFAAADSTDERTASRESPWAAAVSIRSPGSPGRPPILPCSRTGARTDRCLRETVPLVSACWIRVHGSCARSSRGLLGRNIEPGWLLFHEWSLGDGRPLRPVSIGVHEAAGRRRHRGCRCNADCALVVARHCTSEPRSKPPPGSWIRSRSGVPRAPSQQVPDTIFGFRSSRSHRTDRALCGHRLSRPGRDRRKAGLPPSNPVMSTKFHQRV